MLPALVLMVITVFSLSAAAENLKAAPLPQESDWSHFFSFLKMKEGQFSKFQFEIGALAYHAVQDDWSLTRVEPFIKLRWAVLEKYIQASVFFGIDTSFVSYELSHFIIEDIYDISVDISAQSSGNPIFGGGLQIFLFGWKNLGFYGYGQIQIMGLSDAWLESAIVTINEAEMDIFDQTISHVDLTYQTQQYDCGLIVSYKLFEWFTASATVGYLWFNATIRLTIDEELAKTIAAITKVGAREVIPKRLEIDEGSVFGLLNLRFKIYQWFSVNLEGTAVPSEHPIYYGLLSFIITSNK